MKTDEQTLIDRSRAGDREAFGDLVRQHQDRLFNALVHIVACRADAEDVAQEAFVNAYAGLPRFRGNSGFYTWLYRIAVNLAAARHRRKRPTAFGEGLADVLCIESCPSESPVAKLETAERRSQVGHALSGLPEEFRTVLVLREFERLDYSEIADLLGLKTGTVRSRLHRARAKLRRRLLTHAPSLFEN